MQKIVIIGNGIGGITAARHIRKRSQDEILVISKETDYFFARTALMYIYMGHMRYEDTKPYEDWFWNKNRIQLRRAEVTGIDTDNHTVTLKPGNGNQDQSDGTVIDYDKLIIATGSKPNMFGWPGQDLKNVQGMYSYQDLKNLEEISSGIEHGVIVGGGLIGIELAEMLHSRQKKVSMIVREKDYWDNVLPPEEARMINKQIRRNNIHLYLETELEEIIGDEDGKVMSIRTNKDNKLSCQFVGLTAGVQPNIEWLGDNSSIETNRGILVNEYLQTNIEDVYAIGDCAELQNPPEGRKSIEAVWYVGRIMGETVAHTLTGDKTRYEPGPWFNSAKFIDLEYMVYGIVPARIESPLTSFFWKHNKKEKALRLVYHEDNRQIAGINLMGIRWKMETCMAWLNKKATVDVVVEEMEKAHFDPELHEKQYKDIKAVFDQNRKNQKI